MGPAEGVQQPAYDGPRERHHRKKKGDYQNHRLRAHKHLAAAGRSRTSGPALCRTFCAIDESKWKFRIPETAQCQIQM